jgi:hypothetical protein
MITLQETLRYLTGATIYFHILFYHLKSRTLTVFQILNKRYSYPFFSNLMHFYPPPVLCDMSVYFAIVRLTFDLSKNLIDGLVSRLDCLQGLGHRGHITRLRFEYLLVYTC